jgi:putative membrane protein
VSWLAPWYEWLLVLHILSFVSWMAGLFYLPRLFVYHAETATPGSELSETFKVMERRLLKAIMNPASIATWLFGLAMILANGWGWFAASPWMWAKLVLVSGMTWFHHKCMKWRKDFEADANVTSGRAFRMWNEAPTLLLIGIVILVIVKPF